MKSSHNINYKKFVFIVLLISISILPAVSALEVGAGTVMNSVGLNLTINFTSSMYVTSFTVDSAYIGFVNLRNSSTADYNITFNVTETDVSYFGSDLPYFVVNTDTSKQISSGLSDPVNATITFIIGRPCDQISRISYNSNTSVYNQTYQTTDYTCTDSIITLDVNGIEESASNNVITILYSFDNEDLNDFCSGLMDGTSSLGQLMAVIIIAIVLVTALVLFMDGNLNMIQFFIASLITIVLVVIINIIGGIIITSIC